MIIKVCGMRVPDNICQISKTGIDWMGFIFYEKSPRFIGSEIDRNTMKVVSESYLKQIQKVGVFVDATFDQMMKAVQDFQLDYLQLHGNESYHLCHKLKREGVNLIKAFGIASADDLQKTEAYQDTVDYFLFDTRCEEYGGSGKQFDWSVLNSYQGNVPFLLSGGICPQSLEALLKLSHPYLAGIDLNSGFESKPGLKDSEKLRLFIQQLKRRKQ